MNKLELKTFRKKHGLSHEDIAKITGVGIRTVKGWEYGENSISKLGEKLLEQYEKEHPVSPSPNESPGSKTDITEALLLVLRPILNNALSILVEDKMAVVEEKINQKLASWQKITLENQKKIDLVTEIIMMKEIKENSIGTGAKANSKKFEKIS